MDILTQGDPDLKEHLKRREYLIGRMKEWETDRPEAWETALEKLNLKEETCDLTEKFHEAVHARFSFSSYLALNLENGVKDSIVIHHSTWLGIILLMGVFAILHRFAKVDILQLLPWFLGASCVVLLLMVVVSKVQHRRLSNLSNVNERPESHAAKEDRAKTWCEQVSTIHQRCSSETTMLQSLQVCLFLLSYCFARIVVDRNNWQNEQTFAQTLRTCAAYVLLFLVLAYFLPRLVPNFLAVTALPPFVDPKNLEILFSRLLDDHLDSQDSLEKQGVEACHDIVYELADTLGGRSQLYQPLSRQGCRDLEHV